MKLKDRVRNIKKVFKTPYHLFSLTPKGEVVLIFEDKNGQRFQYRGSCMLNALKEAEHYVTEELKMGTFNVDKELKAKFVK